MGKNNIETVIVGEENVHEYIKSNNDNQQTVSVKKVFSIPVKDKCLEYNAASEIIFILKWSMLHKYLVLSSYDLLLKG